VAAGSDRGERTARAIAVADVLILRAIRETSGQAVAVSEEDMLDGMMALAHEAAASLPRGRRDAGGAPGGARHRSVRPGERVVIYNTGSGLKYPEAWRLALARARDHARPA